MKKFKTFYLLPFYLFTFLPLYLFTFLPLGVFAQTINTALDNSTLTFNNTSALPWTVVTDATAVGGTCMKSGTITHNGVTEFSTTVTGPGTLSFKWKVSSESYDALQFLSNGSLQQGLTGTTTTTWTTYNFTIPSGQRILTWRYFKNGAGTSGSDCGWIDDIQLSDGATAFNGIIFNANSGSGTLPANINDINGNVVTLPLQGTLTRTFPGNYTFAGWNTAADGTGISYLAGSQFTINGTTTLYAHWVGVSFGWNSATGGTVPPSPYLMTGNVGTIITLPTPNWYRTGYNLICFNTLSNGTGTDYSFGANYTLVGTLSLVAKWKGVDYKIAFDANGGTGAMPIQNHEVAIPQFLSTNTFTREGYDFLGWATTPSGNFVYIDEQSVQDLSLVANATVTLYAVWSLKGSINNALDNNNLIIANTSPKPWLVTPHATAVGGTCMKSGTILNQERTDISINITGPAIITFKYIVSSQANQSYLYFYDNSAIPSSLLSTSGTTVTTWTPFSYTVPAGQRTLTWRYEKSSAGISGGDCAWIDDVQIISDALVFNGNGSTSGTAPTMILGNNGNIVALPNQGTLAKTGLVFLGWNTNAYGTGTFYPAGFNFAVLSFTTLYAQWTSVAPPSLNTALDNNNLTFTNLSALPWTVEADATAVGGSCAKSGAISFSSFTDFSTLVNGPGTITFKYKVSSETSYDLFRFFDNDEQIVQYSGTISSWATYTYTIPSGTRKLTWRYLKDGSGSAGSDCAWIDDIQLSNGAVAFNGVIFNGNSNFTGILPNAIEGVNGNDVVLPNAGSMAINGYTFICWNSKADGSGIDYSAGANFTISGVTTLYAKWSINTYTVKFDANGSIGAMADQNFIYGTPQNLSQNSFTKTDYGFLGWALSSTGNVVFTDNKMVNNITLLNNGIITLYARFISLNEILDNEDLVFTNDIVVPWDLQSDINAIGGSCLRSGTIGNNAITDFSTTVIGPAIISFKYKVSSETNNDFLRFLDNSTEVVKFSGTTQSTWATFSYNIPSGTSSLTWRYNKDAGGSSGSDCAWIDDVQIVTNANPTFTVTSSVDGNIGGTIYPKGIISVTQGDDITYAISPATGYAFNSLTINGVPAEITGNTYTFTNVQATQTIEVGFAQISTTNFPALVGAIYYSDGTTTMNDIVSINAAKAAGKIPIGIVSYVHPNNPNSGWVVALKDANNGISCAWGPTPEIANIPEFGVNRGMTDGHEVLSDTAGYSYTQTIMQRTNRANYASFVNAYNYKDPNITNNKGLWYLPTGCQLSFINCNYAEISKAIHSLNSSSFGNTTAGFMANLSYWSSTQQSNNLARRLSGSANLTNDTKGTIGSGVRSFTSFSFSSTPSLIIKHPDGSGTDALATNNKIGDRITLPNAAGTGVVFYSPNTGEDLMVAMSDMSGFIPWSSANAMPAGLSGVAVISAATTFEDNLPFHNEIDGYTNTKKIRDMQGAGNTWVAQKVDFENGWYLPATGELFKLYSASSVLHIDGISGYTPLNPGSTYWSSTMVSNSSQAWVLNANQGFVQVAPKTNSSQISTRYIRSATARDFVSAEQLAINVVDGATIQWYKDGVLIAGAINLTLLPTQSGAYFAIVSKDGITQTSKTQRVLSVPAIPNFTITSSVGGNVGGTVSPLGAQTVTKGNNITFTMTADPGYSYNSLFIDGSGVEKTGNTYTFTNVQAHHTLQAWFDPIPGFNVTFKSQDGATTLGTAFVNSGETAVYPGELPTKAKSLFWGWATAANQRIANDDLSNVTANRTVYATFNLLGDSNFDGVVNNADITNLINYIMGNSPFPFNFILSDTNKDSTINNADITALLNIIFLQQ